MLFKIQNEKAHKENLKAQSFWYKVSCLIRFHFSCNSPMEVEIDDSNKSLTNHSSPTSKCFSPYERIIYAGMNRFQNNILEYGPVKLSIGDMCTLLPPGHSSEFKEIKSAVSTNFVPGWLTDKVYTVF